MARNAMNIWEVSKEKVNKDAILKRKAYKRKVSSQIFKNNVEENNEKNYYIPGIYKKWLISSVIYLLTFISIIVGALYFHQSIDVSFNSIKINHLAKFITGSVFYFVGFCFFIALSYFLLSWFISISKDNKKLFKSSGIKLPILWYVFLSISQILLFFYQLHYGFTIASICFSVIEISLISIYLIIVSDFRKISNYYWIPYLLFRITAIILFSISISTNINVGYISFVIDKISLSFILLWMFKITRKTFMNHDEYNEFIKEINDSLYEDSEQKTVFVKINSFNKFKKELMNKKGWTYIVLAIISMALVVVIPVAFVIGSGSQLIGTSNGLYEANGFHVKNHKSNTNFLIKHKDTNMYIDIPNSDDSLVNLTSNTSHLQSFIFEENPDSNNSKLSLMSTSTTHDGKNLYLTSKEGSPVFSTGNFININKPNNLNSIKIGKHGSSNEFSIYSEYSGMFLSSIDQSSTLGWSNNPDWFIFEATNTEMNDFNELNEYWLNEKNKNQLIEGIEGNAIAIKSTKTNKFLSTENIVSDYQNVQNNTSKEKLSLSKYPDYNFFLSVEEDNSTSPISSKFRIGFFIDNIIDKNNSVVDKNDFPFLTYSNNDELSFFVENAGFPLNSRIFLELNKINLREFSIKIENNDQLNDAKYLNTSQDKVYLSNTPEYFNFQSSSLTSSQIRANVVFTNSSMAKYRIKLNNPRTIWKMETRAKGHSIDDPTKEYDTGWINHKVSNAVSSFWFKGLPANYIFDDVQMNIHRIEKSANHVTNVKLDKFRTISWTLPDLPDENPAHNNGMREVEKRTISYEKNSPATSVQVEVDFSQTLDLLNLVNKITFLAYEFPESWDDSNWEDYDVVESTPIQVIGSKKYKTNIEGLKPETNYLVVTRYDNEEIMIDDNDPEEDEKGADKGINSFTFRTHRDIPVVNSNYSYDGKGNYKITINPIKNIKDFDRVTLNGYDSNGNLIKSIGPKILKKNTQTIIDFKIDLSMQDPVDHFELTISMPTYNSISTTGGKNYDIPNAIDSTFVIWDSNVN